MTAFNIEILNPKAKKLLFDLAELRLISISVENTNSFTEAIHKIRSKKANISMDEITKEIEIARTKRYGK